jgi:hypothetical protein
MTMPLLKHLAAKLPGVFNKRAALERAVENASPLSGISRCLERPGRPEIVDKA